MRHLICAIAVATVSLAHASDLDQCDFNKSDGQCNAAIKVDKSANTYTIPASGQCRTVSVLIDGTQYAHGIKDNDVTDSVMQMDKSKGYSVSVSACTSHPTKKDVLVACENKMNAFMETCTGPVMPGYNACIAPLAPEVKATKEGVKPCADVANNAFDRCYIGGVNLANACVGAPAFSYTHDSQGFATHTASTY